MKFFGVLLLALSVSAASLPNDVKPLYAVKHGRVSENMNEYLDQMLEMVGPWLKDNNMDPMTLPDMIQSFESKPLLITYHGEMSLKNGQLFDIKDILRRGDAFMGTDDNKITIEAGIAVGGIEITYDYLVELMGIGPNGWIEGHFGDIVIEGNVEIEIGETLKITLNTLKISSVGAIDVKLTGNVLTDWLGNTLIKVVTFLFKGPLVNFVSSKLKDIVQGLIDNLGQDSAMKLLRAATQ